ncbi:MAG: HAMP domain-containing histidine kinase [Elusimicrobiaceae bacterium]|nr:HAMP domain-containing histidine kinase [Elusimicrobiaceae bacterium]
MSQIDLNVNPRILTMIAHKLRTPLSIINGYCEALLTQEQKNLAPFSAKALEEINLQGSHLSQLVDQLVSFNKVSAVKPEELEKKSILLKPLIKECAARILSMEEHLDNIPPAKNEALRKGTFIETDCPSELSLTANAEMLRLCIEELLSNAIKFNNKTEKIIKLQGVNHGNCISLSVRDYGTGIRPQDVNRIFEPFYQVDDLTGQITGWGLGLTMVRRILELHGGSVSVVSDRGLGSIFTVNFPA